MSSPAVDLLSHPYHKNNNLGGLQIPITINISKVSHQTLSPLNVITSTVGIFCINQIKLLLNLSYKLLSQSTNTISNLCITQHIQSPVFCD